MRLMIIAVITLMFLAVAFAAAPTAITTASWTGKVSEALAKK